MTQHEKMMYGIIAGISKFDTPLVFKGGLVTKLVLAENDFHTIERMTKDIDASWVGKAPSMSELINTINLGLDTQKYIAVAERDYTDKRSAGISIVEKQTGDKIVSMDIDVKPVYGEKEYYVGETSIKGVLVDEIIADKICALSGNVPFRRTKDMIDIYALTQCVDVKIQNIFRAFEKTNRICGDFNVFTTRTNDMEHAYNKLNVVRGKPPFYVVYSYLQKFFAAFSNQVPGHDKIWNCKTMEWEDVLVPKEQTNISQSTLQSTLKAKIAQKDELLSRQQVKKEKNHGARDKSSR